MRRSTEERRTARVPPARASLEKRDERVSLSWTLRFETNILGDLYKKRAGRRVLGASIVPQGRVLRFGRADFVRRGDLWERDGPARGERERLPERGVTKTLCQ